MIKRTGSSVEVLQGAETLPQSEAVELYTDAEHWQLSQQRLAEIEMQMPSFFRGDEDEDADALLQQ